MSISSSYYAAVSASAPLQWWPCSVSSTLLFNEITSSNSGVIPSIMEISVADVFPTMQLINNPANFFIGQPASLDFKLSAGYVAGLSMTLSGVQTSDWQMYSPHSFEFWWRPPTGTMSYHPIISFGSGSSSSSATRRGHGLIAVSNTTLQQQLYYNSGSSNVQNNIYRTVNAPDFSPGVWVHFVIMHRPTDPINKPSGTQVSDYDMFVNGRRLPPIAFNGNTPMAASSTFLSLASGTTVWVGSVLGDTTPAAGGGSAYSNIAFYNRALSFDEIANHYYSGLMWLAGTTASFSTAQDSGTLPSGSHQLRVSNAMPSKIVSLVSAFAGGGGARTNASKINPGTN